MTHELKIWPQYYCRVADGSKTFEIRVNDRGFQPGDFVVLREYDPTPVNPTSQAPKGYTDSPSLKFKVGYIFVIGFDPEIGKEKVVFSLLPITEDKKKKSIT